MFITNEDFNNFCDVTDATMRYLTCKNKDRNDALLNMGKAVKKAEKTIEQLKQKKEKDNKRKAEYIAEKRKIDPRYGGNDKRKYKD